PAADTSSDRLAAELLADSEEQDVALRVSDRFVHRVVRASTNELEGATASRGMLSAADGHAFTLEIGKAGSLDALRFREILRRSLIAGEVEIKIQSAALNFRDVLTVLGLLPEEVYEDTFHGHNLGMEAAGVVTQVGEGVHEYKAGDAIVASLRGSFSSHV